MCEREGLLHSESVYVACERESLPPPIARAYVRRVNERAYPIAAAYVRRVKERAYPIAGAYVRRVKERAYPIAG